MYLTYRDENRTLASIGLWRRDLRDADRRRRAGARARSSSHRRHSAGARRAADARAVVHEHRSTDPRPRGRNPSFSLTHSGNGDSAVTKRRSGASSRWRRRAAAGGRPFAGPWQVVGIMPRDFRFLDMAPQPDVIVAMRLDPARRARSTPSATMRWRDSRPASRLAEARADLERMLPIWLDAWPLAPGSTQTKEAFANSANHPGRSPFEGRLGRRRRGHVVGAHGCDRCRAADRVRQHRESDARAGGRAAAGVRRARGARRGPGAYRERVVRREPGVWAQSEACSAWGSHTSELQVLVAIGPTNLPRLQEIAVYPPVLAFTVAISLASTLVFGSITALKHALHIDTPMSGSARGSSASRERSTTRSALVVVQVALALVLVVSAALMIRTFQALRDVDPGFSDPATIQTAGISIPSTLVSDPEPAGSRRRPRMQHEILDRIAALPGVASVGFANDLPMGGGHGQRPRLRSKARRSQLVKRRPRAAGTSSRPAISPPWARE